jgi:hypothetical protein
MATRAENAAAQKQARQRKLLLLLLVPALAIVLVVQGPRLKDQLQGAQEKTQSVQGQVVEGIKEVAPTDSATPGATTATGEASSPTDPLSSATAALADGQLPNTDELTPADEDELISFTRFAARDPFVQLVDETSADAASAAAPVGGTSDTGALPEPIPVPVTTPGTGTTDGTATTGSTQASISVNGIVAAVSVGETFPDRDPAFTLVAIEGNTVKIGLSDGTFSTGGETIDLSVGDSVTLISQPDGARFTVNIIEIA